MTSGLLKKFVFSAPSFPGIYTFKERSRKLYIGKAANLKVRLRSYLKTADPRIQKMLSLARSVEFRPTESDIEALILESQHIKKHKPAFNIMLRDDKQYAFVGFTEEKYPKIFITHQPQKVLSIRYPVLSNRNNSHDTKYTIHNTDFIGPFTDVGALKITLRYLRRIFPYCTCKKPHNNYCLNYHIGKCLGFCCLKNPVSSIKYRVLRDYRKNIRAVREILSGKKNSLIKNLRKEMQKLAKRGKLEKAIELRDKLEKLKRVFENAKIIKSIDISKYGYKNKKMVSDLAEILGLSKAPFRIEGYDISNIQGAYATGSMVTFVGGRPDKNFYRKFKIFRKKTADDTAMLREILERRFKHDEWPFPDLVLIDGGRGQLNAARAAISNFQFSNSKQIQNPKFKIPIIALTKDKKHKGEKIYVAKPPKGGFAFSEKKPIPLSQLPLFVKNLLLQINSEAHRFAISYYRKLHRDMVKIKKPRKVRYYKDITSLA